MPLTISHRRPGELTPAEVAYMRQLYEAEYVDDAEPFASRFASFERIALFHDRGWTGGEPRIVGFALPKFAQLRAPSGPFTAIGLGLTIVDAPYRNRGLIQRLICALMAEARLRAPLDPIYVWALAATFRPYLIFARNLRDYHPRPERELDPERAAIMAAIGRHHFGGDFDPELGCVRDRAWVLREPAHRVEGAHPDIAFYDQRRWLRPDITGVVVLAPGNLDNLGHWLGRALTRVWSRGRARGSAAASNTTRTRNLKNVAHHR